MTLLLLCLLATTPAASPAMATHSLAQIEKQALEIQRLAKGIQDLAAASRAQGRPQSLAALESDVASLLRHLGRLERAIGELGQAKHDKIKAR